VFRTVDEIRPKGFAASMEVSELRIELSEATEEERLMCRRWEAAYAALRRKDPVVGLAEVMRFLADYPDDALALRHAEQFRSSSAAELSPGIQADFPQTPRGRG
jgi:adenylate cyclase